MTDGSDGESTDTKQLAATDSTGEFMIGDEVLVKITQVDEDA